MLKKLFRHVSAPLVALTLAAALVPAAAQAQRVEWRGFGYIQNFNEECQAVGYGGAMAMTARFRPSDIGDNGGNTILSFFNDYSAFNVNLSGRFSREWQPVNAGAVNVYAYMWPEGTEVRVRAQAPSNSRLRARTRQIRILGDIRNFDGIEGCVASFEVTLIKRPQ